jgi:ribosomal protein S18 acetylase RimI-like enzyme/Icc-related predicted phosphoesterase
MIIAQISDMHVRRYGQLASGRVDTAWHLARSVEHIMRMTPGPDVVLATGDLVDAGDREEYRHLRDLLSPLSMPVYLIPGNHDDREALVGALGDHAYLPRSGFLHYALEQYPVRLIGLDTLVPGEVGGRMCEERLRWLDERLRDAPDRPTVIFMHHPPFRTGIGHMDRMGLAGIDAMGEVIRRHPQVERVLCGHLHRPIHVRWCGTVVMTAPSTAHQVVLELREDAPLAFAMEPPAVMLHVWRDDLGLVSHTSYVGEYAGPYPFRGGEPERDRAPQDASDEDLVLRPAGPDDAGAIEACVRAAYAKYVPRLGREPEPMRADYRALVDAGQVHVLLAQGAVIGALVLMNRGDHLFIDNVAVVPAWQGRGLGRALMAFAEEAARLQGLPELRLYTNARMTENLRLYRLLGFGETDRRHENGYDRVYMRKAIESGGAAGEPARRAPARLQRGHHA